MFQSHTKREILRALAEGKEVYRLKSDAGTDHLIGSLTECQNDVMAYYGLEEMPSYWALTKVDRPIE